MYYFEGCICAHCGRELTEKDEIVACPVCGSPHHRECYNERGTCANEALHEEGFAWRRAENESSTEKENSTGRKVYCGVCGSENAAGRLYCNNCGKPLFDDEAGTRATDSEGNNPFSGEKIDEIPLTDVQKFVGSSGVLYAPLFYQMHVQKKKVSFNFIALFFPSFWYLSRKMYLHGLSIILFNILSYCFSLFNAEAINRIYNASMTMDQEALINEVIANPYLFAGFMFFGTMSYVIAILSALFSNKLYMNWSLRKIRRLRRRKKDDAAYQSALESHGRSNFGVVIIILLLYFVAILAVERFLL